MWNPGYLLVAEFDILGFGIENLATANRAKPQNRKPQSRQRLESEIHYLFESGIHLGIQNSRLSWIPLHGVNEISP